MTNVYASRLTHAIEGLLAIEGLRVMEKELLSKRTTWRVGGPADLWLSPETESALVSSVECLDKHDIPWVVLGKGSNTLACDEGFKGAVFNLERGLKQIEKSEWHDDECVIEVGAGTPLSALLRFVSKQEVGGLEMLTGIPGTVGGAVRMNAGTHLGETKDRLIEAKLMRDGGPLEWVSADSLDLEYRNSNLGPRDIVTSARFRGKREGGKDIGQVIKDVRERRKATQPLTEASGGSTFANPPEGKAWSLLDKAGSRGHRIGGAWFSELHANFLIQGGDGTAQDIEDLIILAKKEVHKQFGIKLREEVSRLETDGWVEEEQDAC